LNYLFSTNHYQAESLKTKSNQSIVEPNSLEHFNKVKSFIEKRNGKFSLNNIMDFLSSHVKGVCNHFEGDGFKSATIYSWIAEIPRKEDPIQAWATIGSPCKSKYETYTYF
jgi:hypothetical protein